ncbi:MAG: shikimate kinase [Clostridia bacterium]
MRIFLIGFMRSGKSTIAKALSKEYGLATISMDDIFRSKYGSINAYFQKYGEKSFRIKEQEILFNTNYPTNCIVSCGGGIVEKWKNMIFIRSRGKVVFLECSLEILFSRVDNINRPNWKDENYTRNLFEKRQSLYFHYADLVINNIRVKETLERIRQYAPNIFY